MESDWANSCTTVGHVSICASHTRHLKLTKPGGRGPRDAQLRFNQILVMSGARRDVCLHSDHGKEVGRPCSNSGTVPDILTQESWQKNWQHPVQHSGRNPRTKQTLCVPYLSNTVCVRCSLAIAVAPQGTRFVCCCYLFLARVAF